MAGNDSPTPRPAARWERYSLALLGIGIAALVASVALFVFTILDSGNSYSGPGTSVAVGDPRSVFVPAPTSTPSQLVSTAPIARLTIPKYEVDAPVIVLGVDEQGVMESPDGPFDVAWYDFTAHPGTGSNAVFSGHVDWTFDSGPGGAVFWHLKDLALGDIIEVKLTDGTVFQYRMVSRQQIDPNTADVNAIVGPTPRDVITLITCGGSFDRSIGHYTARTIVQAERVPDDQSAARGPASP